MFYILCQDYLNQGEKLVVRDNTYRATVKYLEESRQMYTLGPKYYQEISDLYYLYDDFNDRHIHHQQALQMASADVNTILNSIVEEQNYNR